jgi:hypothetical protein
MRQKLQYMVVVERGATSYGAKEEFKTCSPIAKLSVIQISRSILLQQVFQRSKHAV